MGYDDWKTACPEDDGAAPVDCVVCTGHPHAPPCSEECNALAKRIRAELKRRSHIKHLYKAARTCLKLARQYRREDGTVESTRLRKVEYQVNLYRADIADLRRASRAAFAELVDEDDATNPEITLAGLEMAS